MTEKLIAIDPKKVDDNFYRYKMPAITVKVEGNGNGIKTVFPNLHDICARIRRPESIVLSFLQFELGTQKITNQKDDKFIVMGSHAQDRLQTLVYTFIERFVLCKIGDCRNPETNVVIESRDRVTLQCRACGKTSSVSPGEKAYQLFVAHYKNAPKEDDAPTGGSVVTTAAANAAAAAPETIQKSTDVDERENPIDILAREMKKDPRAIDVHVRCTYELRTTYNLEEKFLVRLVFRAACKDNESKFISALISHADLLSRFALVKDASKGDDAAKAELEKKQKVLQATLLSELELLAAKHGMHKMPIAMKALFEAGLLSEKSIDEWHKGKSKTEVQLQMRKLSDPLIAWIGA